MENKVLLGLTTTPKSKWRENIKEIDRFSLSEIALFATGMKAEERKECYELLEKTDLKEIPHVHLRDDMAIWEIEYLIKKFKTQLFNTHPQANRYRFDFKKCPQYTNKIFIENVEQTPAEKELENSGGLCIDFSHWENSSMKNDAPYCKEMISLTEKYPIGCCHISAVTSEPQKDAEWGKFTNHYLSKLSELDYMKKYVKYLPKYISLELENSFEEQLACKKYLEKIIYEKRN